MKKFAPMSYYTDDELLEMSYRIFPLPWKFEWEIKKHVRGGGRYIIRASNGSRVSGRMAMLRICNDANSFNSSNRKYLI